MIAAHFFLALIISLLLLLVSQNISKYKDSSIKEQKYFGFQKSKFGNLTKFIWNSEFDFWNFLFSSTPIFIPLIKKQMNFKTYSLKFNHFMLS